MELTICPATRALHPLWMKRWIRRCCWCCRDPTLNTWLKSSDASSPRWWSCSIKDCQMKSNDWYSMFLAIWSYRDQNLNVTILSKRLEVVLFIFFFLFIPMFFIASPLRNEILPKKAPPSCLQWVICLTSNRSGRLMPACRSESHYQKGCFCTRIVWGMQ